MDYKKLAINILRRNNASISFTIEQMIDFIINNCNARLCTEEEAREVRYIYIKLPNWHSASRGGLMYRWGFYSPSEDVDWGIRTLQIKNTGEYIHLYSYNDNNWGNGYATILLSTVSLFADEHLFFSWDNDNEIALEQELIYRFSVETRPEMYYKSLYEILQYFKY